jgi:hypothetical protein
VAMRCTTCGAELILTNVVPDTTIGIRGFEHHSFICSACHATEHRVLFMRHGREGGAETMQEHLAPRITSASTVQEGHIAAPGLFGRVVAKMFGH